MYSLPGDTSASPAPPPSTGTWGRFLFLDEINLPMYNATVIKVCSASPLLCPTWQRQSSRWSKLHRRYVFFFSTLHLNIGKYYHLSNGQVRDILRGSPDEEGCPREVELIAHGRGKPEVVNISDCEIVGQGGWFGLTIQLSDRICWYSPRTL